MTMAQRNHPHTDDKSGGAFKHPDWYVEALAHRALETQGKQAESMTVQSAWSDDLRVAVRLKPTAQHVNITLLT